MKEDFSAYPDVRKFLQYLAVEKNTSALTVKNYGADIAVFIEFLKTRYSGGFNWNDISVPDIRSYLAEMNGKPCGDERQKVRAHNHCQTHIGAALFL